LDEATKTIRTQVNRGFFTATAARIGPADRTGLERLMVVDPATLAWITRHRRTVRDYERLPAHHETYLYWSMIIVMTRRLARKPDAASTSAPAQADAA
jgi:hypothetical protein